MPLEATAIENMSNERGEAPGEYPLWEWGVFICLCGTLLTALGLVLQKFSHTKNAGDPAAVVYYRQPWWQFGFSVFLFGQIMNLVAMGMALQAVLSSLGAGALIFNAIFAWMILGERILRLELLSMGGMVAGAFVVTCFHPAGQRLITGTHGVQEIVSPLFSAPFLWLTGGIVLFLVLLRTAMVTFFPANFSIYLALCSAVSSGYTIALFKCISFLFLSWKTVHPLAHWQFYLVLAVALVLCVLQIHTLNLALHLGRAMTVVPVVFAFSLMAQISLCEVAYKEMRGITGIQAALSFGGVVLIMISIAALVRVKIKGEPLQEDAEKASLTVPLLREGSKSEPHLGGRTWSRDAVDTIPVPRTWSLDVEAITMSSLDFQSLRDSPEGRYRAYTVSVTGPMGLI